MLRTIGALLVVMGAAGTGVGLSVFVRHSAGILQQLIMTGLKVRSVNVDICGISLPREPKK